MKVNSLNLMRFKI